MIIGKTESLCPVCLGRISAKKVVGRDGFVYLEKSCPDHGEFSALIWEDTADSYLSWGSQDTPGKVLPVGAQLPERGCPYDCGLCQNHERDGCCVLLELTNRCNLRCPVCFASAGDAAPQDLTLEEIGRQYDLLMQRGGPFNIQLSGGEPTLRDDLPEIVALGREKGFSFFQLNTNGLRLGQEDGYAQHLAQAGVSTVFLQFDGLDDEIYQALRGTALYEKKCRAIAACEKANLPVVLVPTIVPGINDQALGQIIRFGLEHAPHVRGVHMQPVSYFGRWDLHTPPRHLTIPGVLRRIETQTQGKLKAADFGGGGAESPYCSFHASYLHREDGSWKALPRRRNACCCVKSSDAREAVSRQWSAHISTEGTDPDTASLDAFLAQIVRNTFTVSGMVFQDAYNLDLERLRRCYICEADSQYGMVPFCAYNLTGNAGRALYRR